MTLDKETVEYGIRVFETIGFPAVVACWHMFRSDKRLEDNTRALQDLKEYIQEKLK